MNFVSDNWDQGNGFKLRYYALDAVENYSGIEDLNVYPNPVSDNLFLDFSMPESGNITVRLMDMTGKTVLVDAFEAALGQNKHFVNVSGLRAGMYLLQMETKTGKIIQKVLVQ